MLEIIRIEGWGSRTELRGLVIDSEYAPGLFEALQLGLTVLGVTVTAMGLGASVAFLIMEAWFALALAFTVAVLGFAVGAWAWFRTLPAAHTHTCKIRLSDGLVQYEGAFHDLRNARLDVESAGLWEAQFSKVALICENGPTIPIAQGRYGSIEHLVHAITHAPCFTPRREESTVPCAPPVRQGAAA